LRRFQKRRLHPFIIVQTAKNEMQPVPDGTFNAGSGHQGV
jgi:hypothetical protein